MFAGKNYLLVIIIIAIFLMLSGGLDAGEKNMPEKHPIELTDRPICSDCHPSDEDKIMNKPFKTFNHTGDYIKRHKYYASQSSNLCSICHKTSFCTNCHSYKEELLPSVKESIKPERWLPHRNNYLFRHRIDGKIDPTSCFRCHGRQNNQRCKKCHK